MSETEPKRLFVAIPVLGKVKEGALAWQADHPNWPVRFLAGDNLHITVVSPWLETDVDLVVEKLDKFVSDQREPFSINFFKVVFGPNRFNPRLIWAEGQAPVSLLELKNRLEQALAKPDNRFYRLHLTLGRFHLEDFGSAGLPDLFDRVDWTEEVKSFALFESTLSQDGADYRQIKEFSFS
jgi:2'-5' RNA ligase